MKLLGAGLIISVSLWIGVNSYAGLYRHSRTLECIISALCMLRAEMSSRLTPLPAACRTAARNSAYPANVFFGNVMSGFSQLGEKSFSQIWSESVKSTGALSLTSGEAESLSNLGTVLGRFCAEEQDALFERTLDSLKAAYADAEETRKRNGRLYVSCSAAAGVLAVIMLI